MRREAAKAAHALKSMSLNIGAKAVAERAGAIEAEARESGRVRVGDSQTLHQCLLATLAVLGQDTPAAPAPAIRDEEKALIDDLAKAGRAGRVLPGLPAADRPRRRLGWPGSRCCCAGPIRCAGGSARPCSCPWPSSTA